MKDKLQPEHGKHLKLNVVRHNNRTVKCALFHKYCRRQARGSVKKAVRTLSAWKSRQLILRVLIYYLVYYLGECIHERTTVRVERVWLVRLSYFSDCTCCRPQCYFQIWTVGMHMEIYVSFPKKLLVSTTISTNLSCALYTNASIFIY